jgi:serine/threonine protein kinase
MRMDAIIAERLSWSNKIVDIYGFCGTGMINEAMRNGDAEKKVSPLGHRFTYNGSDTNGGLLVVKNDLSGSQKLKYALEMVEAVAVLHSYIGGVIVHDDIQLSQYLLSDDGHLKLNDFNRAEIMLWNGKDQEYCRYRNDVGQGGVSLHY